MTLHLSFDSMSRSTTVYGVQEYTVSSLDGSIIVHTDYGTFSYPRPLYLTVTRGV